MAGAGSSEDAELRRLRRDWIRVHHPDAGGDPEEFIAGLRRFATPGTGPRLPGGDHRPTVYRSRNPLRRLRRTYLRLVRGKPARRLF